MSKIIILGNMFVLASIISGIALYKLEIRKTAINEEYEYIKRHRAFGNLTKYLSIIAIISILLLNFNFLVYKDYEFKNLTGKKSQKEHYELLVADVNLDEKLVINFK